MNDEQIRLSKRLQREKRARLEAEKLLEAKTEELYELLMRTRESESLLNSALVSMTDGLLLTDVQHNIVLCNARLGEIYAVPRARFKVGASLAGHFDELTTHPDYLAVLKGDAPERRFELELGEDQWVLIGVSRTESGLIASTHKDISDIKQGEEERRDLLLELTAAQRMETIGRMSGMIAHDFNNIIASIKGYAGLLRDDLVSHGDQNQYINRILASSERADALIRHIHDIGNRSPVRLHRVSVMPVIDDCLDMIRPEFPDGVEIVFDPPEEPVWVTSNEGRLVRLFINLLTNSMNAMRSAGGKLTIDFERLECFSRDPGGLEDAEPAVGRPTSNHVGPDRFDHPVVKITITDDGEGIQPEVMKRVFEMYFSTRKSGQGGGVGMSSVTDIAWEVGHFVGLVSTPGEGTASEVVIPLATPLAQKMPERSEAGSARYDVMIIDDDEDVGLMIQSTLERENISASYHQSPERALQLLLSRRQDWRVVICDQIMPDLKGSEVYEKLRQSGIDIPFILCSGQIDAADLADVEALSENLVSKPIGRHELIDKIRRYL